MVVDAVLPLNGMIDLSTAIWFSLLLAVGSAVYSSAGAATPAVIPRPAKLTPMMVHAEDELAAADTAATRGPS